MGDNYYDLLGVDEAATTEEVEAAYREKLKETHPDVSDEADASERTRRLIDAKETLTDEDERRQYDRLGHEQYVEMGTVDAAGGGAAADNSGSETASAGRGPTESTSAGRGPTGSRSAGRGPTESRSAGRGPTGSRSAGRGSAGSRSAGNTAGGRTGNSSATRSANPGGAGWTAADGTHGGRRGRARGGGSDGSVSDRTDAESDSQWRAWSTDNSYAVGGGEESQRFGGAFADQQSFVLLSTTFAVYPVLLFGALSDTFPLAVNLLVALCVVLVIAFLQSVPEVGILVFGLWTVVLPLGMATVSGLDLLSIRPVIAMVAVVFPLGLSVLTHIAIRPMTVD